MLGNEFVVDQMRVIAADAIDLLRLARRERLVRVEAAGRAQQALAVEHVLDAGDAAGEVVGRVEQGGVAVGYLRRRPGGPAGSAGFCSPGGGRS